MEDLTHYENLWGLHPDDPHRVTDPNQVIQLCKNVLDISLTMSPEFIQDKFREHIDSLIDVHNNLKNSEFEVVVRINRLLEFVYYSQNVCVSLSRMQEVMDQTTDFRDNTDGSLFRFKAIDVNENTKFQNFLLYILGNFHKKRYARYNGDVYKSITTPEGYNTLAWKRVGTINEIIYKSICKETNYDQFINFTHRGDSVRAATEFLSNCSDRQFPALMKNRHVFSFRNGVYLAHEDAFVEYTDARIKDIGNIVSAKYFGKFFTPCEDSWKSIETPYFDSIFKHQNVSDEVMEWVYAFTGRLIYGIDELDGWQVIFFVQGQAGTGKSTYANAVCKHLYDEEDVGIMSNNIQRQFGLSDLVDKMIYVAPEIKRDFNIEQGEFQSIISGDKVTINIKFKNSRFENWTIPGVMAGNECPDFIDNAGSIQRRMVTLRFTNKVRKGDLLLGKKIQEEMASIILKCNKAYREKADLYGRESVWNVLPQYFINTQQELARSTNPLINFLLSENITFDENKYIPESVFKDRYNIHCRESNYSKHKFNPDFYMGPFAQYNIKVTGKEKRMYNGSVYNCVWFQGVDISSASLIDEEPDDI